MEPHFCVESRHPSYLRGEKWQTIFSYITSLSCFPSKIIIGHIVHLCPVGLCMKSITFILTFSSLETGRTTQLHLTWWGVFGRPSQLLGTKSSFASISSTPLLHRGPNYKKSHSPAVETAYRLISHLACCRAHLRYFKTGAGARLHLGCISERFL